MNFRKVSDTELRCSVSMDEIHEKGLEVSDLMKRSDKTFEFFEYLVQEAQEETGFEKTGPMSVEGVFLNGNLELIFRCMDEEDEEEWDRLDRMEHESHERDLPEPEKPSLFDMTREDKENENLKLVQICFSSVGELYRFCQLVPFADKIPSSLYQMDERYILVLDMDNLERKEIGAFCLIANEYGVQSEYGDLQASRVMEFGKHICDDALYQMHEMKSGR